MKKFSKGILLAAAFAVLAAIGHVSGFNQYVATRFGDVIVEDLKLNGNDILDSNGTTRITVGSTNAIVGNTTVTGNLTPSGTTYFTIATSSAPRDVSASIGIIPTAMGQLAYNITDKELCLSTATNRFSWVEVSSGTVLSACKH